MSAFFVLAFSHNAYADSCTSDSLSKPEAAVVKWVYDGDTLLLTDKRKIRIIGIDTPEVKHHQQKEQAYAAKAREALRELLKHYDYNINLRFGKEKQDRYKRQLAHVYTPDGINISNWLLEQGFARLMSIPPNVALANCYQKAEAQARSQSLRIWRLKRNQTQTVKSLSKRRKGYVRLKGKVIKIIRHKKSLLIELDSHTKRHIQVKIKKRNLSYFKKLDPDKLWGQTIEISGILKKKHGKRRINLSHPSQLTVLHKAKAKKNVKPILKWSE